jgi:hypothetical protein
VDLSLRDITFRINCLYRTHWNAGAAINPLDWIDVEHLGSFEICFVPSRIKQSTGQALTFTPIHGSAITNAIINSLSDASNCHYRGAGCTGKRADRSLSAAGVESLIAPRRTRPEDDPAINSTSHSNWVNSFTISVGFFRHYRYFKEIARERRRLYFPFQPGSPPRIRPRDRAVLQRPE